MAKPYLILLILGLYKVCSICFVKNNIIERKQEIDRPKAVDDYHCKIICAERKDCFSFTFADNRCKLFGKVNISSSPTVEVPEWRNIKKTSSADCREIIEQPLITKGYSPNPAITYLTELDDFEIEYNTWQPCLKGWILEAMLPGNLYRLEGDSFNHIHWDGKIGSWILTKKTEQSNTNTTLFIRAARCFLITPDLYGDPKPCGGPLPTMTVSPGFYGTPPKRFGDRFATDFGSSVKTVYSSYHGLVCIDGSWIYLKRSDSRDVLNAWKILKGMCV